MYTATAVGDETHELSELTWAIDDEVVATQSLSGDEDTVEMYLSFADSGAHRVQVVVVDEAGRSAYDELVVRVREEGSSAVRSRSSGAVDESRSDRVRGSRSESESTAEDNKPITWTNIDIETPEPEPPESKPVKSESTPEPSEELESTPEHTPELDCDDADYRAENPEECTLTEPSFHEIEYTSDGYGKSLQEGVQTADSSFIGTEVVEEGLGGGEYAPWNSDVRDRAAEMRDTVSEFLFGQERETVTCETTIGEVDGACATTLHKLEDGGTENVRSSDMSGTYSTYGLRNTERVSGPDPTDSDNFDDGDRVTVEVVVQEETDGAIHAVTETATETAGMVTDRFSDDETAADTESKTDRTRTDSGGTHNSAYASSFGSEDPDTPPNRAGLSSGSGAAADTVSTTRDTESDERTYDIEVSVDAADTGTTTTRPGLNSESGAAADSVSHADGDTTEPGESVYPSSRDDETTDSAGTSGTSTDGKNTTGLVR